MSDEGENLELLPPFEVRMAEIDEKCEVLSIFVMSGGSAGRTIGVIFGVTAATRMTGGIDVIGIGAAACALSGGADVTAGVTVTSGRTAVTAGASTNFESCDINDDVSIILDESAGTKYFAQLGMSPFCARANF